LWSVFSPSCGFKLKHSRSPPSGRTPATTPQKGIRQL
jgi:hypothetical protein